MLAPASPLHDFSQLISPPLFFRDEKETTASTSSDTLNIKWDVVRKRFTTVLGTINVNASYINIFIMGFTSIRPGLN